MTTAVATTVTTAYLAHRAGVVHNNGPRKGAESAIRGGLGAEFVRVRLPFGDGSNRRFLAYRVTRAGIRALAEQCRSAGREDTHTTAAIYDTVADELEAGRLAVEEVEEVRPVERNVEENAAQVARRRRLEGEVMPEARVIGGRAYADQISVAQFIGSQTCHFRHQSIRNLPPTVLARDTLDGTRKVMVGTHRTATRVFLVKLLTAEALDAVAENYDRCTNATGRSRAPRVRQLAEALRAVERLHRMGLKVVA